ncbi:regulatory protein ada [Nannizzia gypsea CBS 118893]|uniref:Regulatory protein ada n=1 Tax=Arthroderma gypseum (strain ATCC MYA-4604 / CBS 118893) TaxID=535722 RepID=E4UTB7_ARTGP|nr:regulatory protein ada [Nannizzia gypsea CBS 118893]EFR00678.1 regulatory protein ada [Nannizzia gypsea CBS 118893]
MTAESDNNKIDYSSTSARWRAIVNRDAAATGFVYGVRTTKIYCRPRCPARLARRANVEFYDTPTLAEKAGYRPCKRCKPEDVRAPTDPHIRLAQRACETMTLAALAGGDKQRPTLSDLSGEAGLTPSHFHRVFKKVVGVTPGKFARELMERKSLGKVMVPSGINARVCWPPPHLAALVGMSSPVQDSNNAVSSSSPSSSSKPQVQTTLGECDIDRNNNNHHHLAAGPAASDPRQQQQQHHHHHHHQQQHINFSRPPTTTPSSTAAVTSSSPVGGICMPQTTASHSFDPSALNGVHSMLTLDPNSASNINFAQYMAEPIDFSPMNPPTVTTTTNSSTNNTTGHSPADTFAHPTPSPTSVPSLYSQQSISPTDSPLMFDSYTGLAGSWPPLLPDDTDWLDSQVLLPPDYTSLDHCARS